MLVLLLIVFVIILLPGIILSVKAQAERKLRHERHIREALEQELAKFREYCASQEKEIELLQAVLRKHEINYYPAEKPVAVETISVVAEVNSICEDQQHHHQQQLHEFHCESGGRWLGLFMQSIDKRLLTCMTSQSYISTRELDLQLFAVQLFFLCHLVSILNMLVWMCLVFVASTLSRCFFLESLPKHDNVISYYTERNFKLVSIEVCHFGLQCESISLNVCVWSTFLAFEKALPLLGYFLSSWSVGISCFFCRLTTSSFSPRTEAVLFVNFIRPFYLLVDLF